MSRSDRLARWTEQHRDRLLKTLQEIVRFPSVSGEPPSSQEDPRAQGFEECLQLLEREADRIGLSHRRFSRGGMLLEGGEGEESLGFPLHIDVVPPGEGWKHGDAFSGAIEEDQIWGRGVQDNKGPLLAVLHGLEAVLALGQPFRRRVQLLIGQGEEIVEWEDIEEVRDEAGPPTFSIVSDSGFPIVTGEKGWVDAVIEAPWPPMESEVQLIRVEAGTRPNVVPDLAEAIVQLPETVDPTSAIAIHRDHDPEARLTAGRDGGRWRIEAQGKRAHGSSPWKGHNAALDLLAFLLEIAGPERSPQHRALIAALHRDCCDHMGEPFGLAGHHEFLGPTTVSLGILRIEGSELSATLNIRPTLGLTCADALARVQARVDQWGVGAKVRSRARTFEPFLRDESEVPELIAALEGAWRDVTGAEPLRVPMSGTTYAKVFPRSVGFGPVWNEQEVSLFHQVDERMPTASHLRNVRLMAEAIARLAL